MSPKPENYIFVSRSESEGSIAGAWILDPRIPDSSAPMRVIVNPDMSYNTARVDRSAGEHLELVTANAPITCDLTLTAHNPRSLDSGRRKVTLFLQTTGKLCKLRVVRSFIATHVMVASKSPLSQRAPDVKQRAPLNIILHTSNATASLYIPRSFRGIVSVAAACACIRMSKAVERSAQPFGFTAGSTRYFVGDPSACRLEDMQTESKGDEAHISAPNGVVWIRYEDEQPSLFARLLALS
ncbi:hypothetical protein BD626DRAFT_500412 [Schizophyllum amplum]|uniref:DUF7330 domain-containing protein n=1 Tax=Schizophyllum amplum TaxID=97359 RepID=A0A550CAD6_9AGAR|nr:hypothetical protein BD626DRAFT_500412 [Auriculariopsis ampla]